MNPADFTAPAAGKLVDIGSGFKAFIPSNLERGLTVPARLTKLLGETRSKLGRRNEGVSALQNPDLFLRSFQKREAVLSSRIEGTVTTLDDAFLREAVGPEEEVPHANPEAQREQEKRIDDALEVRNYELALQLGVSALKTGRPLNVALLKELHRQLLSGVRGETKHPGKVREMQAFVTNRTVLAPEAAHTPSTPFRPAAADRSPRFPHAPRPPAANRRCGRPRRRSRNHFAAGFWMATPLAMKWNSLRPSVTFAASSVLPASSR